MSNNEEANEIVPEVFQERLENLRKRGLLDDPEFKNAFINAARKVREEMADEWAAIQAEKNSVQNPPQNQRGPNRRFPTI